MHATEAESEGLAAFGGGIGSMLPMQPYIDGVYAQDYIFIIHAFALAMAAGLPIFPLICYNNPGKSTPGGLC